MDRKVEFRGVLHEFLLPFAHRLAAPAGYGVLIDGLALVGDNEILVDADHFAVPLAPGAGPQRVVEAEQVLRGVLDSMPSASKREENSWTPSSVTIFADALAVGERAGHRVADAGLRVLVRSDAHAVHHHPDIVGLRVGADAGEDVLDELHPAVRVDPHQALREQQRQLFDNPLPFGERQRRADHHALILVRENPCRHVVHAETAYLLPRDRRKVCPMRANRSLR